MAKQVHRRDGRHGAARSQPPVRSSLVILQRVRVRAGECPVHLVVSRDWLPFTWHSQLVLGVYGQRDTAHLLRPPSHSFTLSFPARDSFDFYTIAGVLVALSCDRSSPVKTIRP